MPPGSDQPFAIVTDTGHNLPPAVLDTLQVHQVPFTINFGVEGSVEDGVLELPEFADLLDRYERGAGYPTTAAPSPGRFVEAFRERIDAGQSRILALTISSGLSKTYESAVQAADIVRQQHPDVEIDVADSRLGTMAEGFMVMEAAAARDKGLSLTEARRAVEQLAPRLRFLATFETTKYLVKSGRARSAQHLLSSVLNIRPIISLRDGAVVLFGRVRGSMDKALDSIVREVRKTRNPGRVAVIEGLAPDLKESLVQRLTGAMDIAPDRILESRIGPSFLVHTGKRAVGVVWEERD